MATDKYTESCLDCWEPLNSNGDCEGCALSVVHLMLNKTTKGSEMMTLKYQIALATIRQAITLKKMDIDAGIEVLTFLFPKRGTNIINSNLLRHQMFMKKVF